VGVRAHIIRGTPQTERIFRCGNLGHFYNGATESKGCKTVTFIHIILGRDSRERFEILELK
jgi:hypothetical protein